MLPCHGGMLITLETTTIDQLDETAIDAPVLDPIALAEEPLDIPTPVAIAPAIPVVDDEDEEPVRRLARRVLADLGYSAADIADYQFPD